MKILIAGISGNIGHHAALHALSQSHTVRGLGRSPTKLDPSLLSQLDTFITSTTYYDIPALERACAGGIDAVICAYSGLPELHLDAQLLLYRAAERAGVRRFLAAGWNYDFRVLGLGDEPVYDAAIMFHRQVALTGGGLRVCHVLSGMLAEVFFGSDGDRGFTTKDGGVWEPGTVEEGRKPRMEVWGTGEEEWEFTTEEDAGRWGVEVVTAEGAERGGFVKVCSWKSGLRGVRECYERVKGVEVGWEVKGSLGELQKRAEEGRRVLGPERFWEWHRDCFMGYCVSGEWNLGEVQNDQFPNVKATSMEEFMQRHL